MKSIVRRSSNLCYDGRRTFKLKDSAMRQIREKTKTQTGAQTAPAPQTPASEARLAAVVQAAYILEARSR
jgi:hypothetical protein